MSFQWSQFNNVGKQLLHHHGVTASFEARCRTAIGRAYYSAFGLAHDYLKERGLHVPTNADSHKVVREYFEDASPRVFGRGKDEDCRLIAAHLDVLRLYRMRRMTMAIAIPRKMCSQPRPVSLYPMR